jgi:hypothetical protein
MKYCCSKLEKKIMRKNDRAMLKRKQEQTEAKKKIADPPKPNTLSTSGRPVIGGPKLKTEIRADIKTEQKTLKATNTKVEEKKPETGQKKVDPKDDINSLDYESETEDEDEPTWGWYKDESENIYFTYVTHSWLR